METFNILLKHFINEINIITKSTYGKLYEKTIIKKNFLLDKGYNYVAIWGSEWKKGINGLIRLQKHNIK